MSEQSRLKVVANFDNPCTWQKIVEKAPKKDDDASSFLIEGTELFLQVEAKTVDEKGNNHLFSSKSDVLKGLTAPINRPRCELQAAYKVIQAILRHGGSDKSKKITEIEVNVGNSLYLATNATRSRLHTWYKNAYKGIANRELWENIRLGLDRLEGAGISCKFVSTLVPPPPPAFELKDLFSEEDRMSKKRKTE